MALDKQIIQLPVKTVSNDLEIAVQNAAGGVGSTGKISVGDILGGIGTQNTKFVSSEGSDVNGNGSLTHPWATLSYAYTQITDASSSNTYIINMQGVFTEATISFKPYIYILGQNSVLNVTNPVTLDASFSAVGELIIQNIQVNFAGGLNFDLSSYSTYSSIFLKDVSNLSLSTWSIKGSSTVGANVIIENTFGKTSEINLELTDCFGNIEGGELQSCNYLATFIGLSYRVSNCTNLGDMFVQSNASSSVVFKTEGGSVFGNYHLKTLTTGVINGLNQNTFIPNLIQIDGVGVVFQTTTTQLVPTLINGALDTSIIYLDNSDTINVNYSAVNYVSVDDRVEGHLRGIDTKLASINPLVEADNIYYVAKNGNDLTGDGSFYNPYATVFNAMDSVTGQSSTNKYCIFILGDETFDVLPVPVKPYTSIVSSSTQVSPNLSLALDNASWTAQPAGTFVLKNISISSINFDWTFLSGENPKLKFISTSVNTFTMNCGQNLGELYLYSNVFENWTMFNHFNLIESIGNSYNAFWNFGITTPIAGGGNTPLSSSSDIFRGQINIKAPNTSNQTSVNMIGATRNMGIPITVEGDQCFLKIDSTSLSNTDITIISGTPDIQYIDNAKSINVTFTPTNYSPFSSQVTGHFEGINSTIGSLQTQINGKLSANPATLVVGGGSLSAGAVLEVNSTTALFVPPRMTTIQRNAIPTKPLGGIVFDTDLGQWLGWNGTTYSVIG